MVAGPAAPKARAKSVAPEPAARAEPVDRRGASTCLIPIREALAESRNAVAVWITTQIGIDAVLRTSRSLGVQTPLQRYATTALGASEGNLLELATAYRPI